MRGVWIGTAIALAAAGASLAQERTVPARVLPVPTDVSPQMQAIVSRPIAPNFNVIPKTVEEWTARQKASADGGAQTLPALAARLHVKVEARQMGGVTVYEVT